MYYVYTLQSLKGRKFYIGYTADLKKRYCQHVQGRVVSTCNRRPLKLVYYQAFVSQIDARDEEKYLKSGGKALNGLKQRLKNSLTF